MLGSGRVSDGYEGSKRPRMMESNPYLAVSSGPVHETYNDVGSKRQRFFGSGPYFPSVGPTGFYQTFASGGGNNNNFPVVRLRGLPFNCDERDVRKFLTGLDIVDCLMVNKNGRFSGEAFVVFSSSVQVEFSLQRDRQNMGRRYVEVFRCTKQEYYQAIASEVNCGGYYDNSPPTPSRPKRVVEVDKEGMEYTEVLKLRGLPYSVERSDIVEFFGEYGIGEDNVHIALRTDGKATGEAFVEFESAESAKMAMSMDKMTIGSRYVELFPSTPEESRRAQSKFR